MTTRAKELDNRKDGDRRQCAICNPRKDRISMDKIWEWQKKHPGVSPWRRPS